MAEEQKKKKGHPVRNTAVAAVLIAALLGGGHYGLGIGRGDGQWLLPSLTGQDAQQAAEPQPQQNEQTGTADGALSIVVQESKILYGGREVGLSELEEALLHDYTKGRTTVTLTDDHAIKGTFDEVSALLAKLEISAE